MRRIGLLRVQMCIVLSEHFVFRSEVQDLGESEGGGEGLRCGGLFLLGGDGWGWRCSGCEIGLGVVVLRWKRRETVLWRGLSAMLVVLWKVGR
jgi:hypothetical protein